jgi:anaerobic ribonucleoside-triphosphate reductase
MDSDQMSSFSMHLIAEELDISRESIVDNYDEIEKLMLQRFFKFASERKDDAIWLHWNMTNINFGFEALEHRHRILTGETPYHINENNRHNISKLLKMRYGANYAKDPKMPSLMELNGGKHRSILTGKEEVDAFKLNEFFKMHGSTMQKVYFFKSVIDKMTNNTLRTENNQFRYKMNMLYQNPLVQILGILGIIGTFVSIAIMLIMG